MNWIRKYRQGLLTRKGRREDAALALTAVALAYIVTPGQNLSAHVILAVLVSLMIIRLIADWRH